MLINIEGVFRYLKKKKNECSNQNNKDKDTSSHNLWNIEIIGLTKKFVCFQIEILFNKPNKILANPILHFGNYRQY